MHILCVHVLEKSEFPLAIVLHHCVGGKAEEFGWFMLCVSLLGIPIINITLFVFLSVRWELEGRVRERER